MARRTYIYKYCNIDCAVSIIENMSFLLRRPSEFNDPFECCPVIDTDLLRADKNTILENDNLDILFKAKKKFGYSGDRSHFKAFLIESGYIDNLYNTILSEKREIASSAFDISKKLTNETLMTCFSRNSRNPLMWAHYADQQKGCVLAFYSYDPIFNNRIQNVIYRKNRPVIDYPLIINNKNIFTEKDQRENLMSKINELLITKSSYWKYEDEVRLIVDKNSYDYKDNDGNKYMRFSKQCLSGIAFGMNVCSEDEKKIDDALKKQGIYSFVHQAITVLHPQIYEIQPFGNPEHSGYIVWPTYNDMIK